MVVVGLVSYIFVDARPTLHTNNVHGTFVNKSISSFIDLRLKHMSSTIMLSLYSCCMLAHAYTCCHTTEETASRTTDSRQNLICIRLPILRFVEIVVRKSPLNNSIVCAPSPRISSQCLQPRTIIINAAA
jgi:hypothetical protein